MAVQREKKTASRGRNSGRIATGGRLSDRARTSRRENRPADIGDPRDSNTALPANRRTSAMPVVVAVIAVATLGIAGGLVAMGSQSPSPNDDASQIATPNSAGNGKAPEAVTTNKFVEPPEQIAVPADEWKRRFAILEKELDGYMAAPPADFSARVDKSQSMLQQARDLEQMAQKENLDFTLRRKSTDIREAWYDQLADAHISKVEAEAQKLVDANEVSAAIGLLETALAGDKPDWLPKEFTSATTPGIMRLSGLLDTLKKIPQYANADVPVALKKIADLAPRVDNLIQNARLSDDTWAQGKQLAEALVAVRNDHRAALYQGAGDDRQPMRGEEWAYDAWREPSIKIFHHLQDWLVAMADEIDCRFDPNLRQKFIVRSKWWLDANVFTGPTKSSVLRVTSRFAWTPRSDNTPQQSEVVARQQRLEAIFAEQQVNLIAVFTALASLDHARQVYRCSADVEAKSAELTQMTRRQALKGVVNLLQQSPDHPMVRTMAFFLRWRFPHRQNVDYEQAFENLTARMPINSEVAAKMADMLETFHGDGEPGSFSWDATMPYLLAALAHTRHVLKQLADRGSTPPADFVAAHEKILAMANRQFEAMQSRPPVTKQLAEIYCSWGRTVIYTMPDMPRADDWSSRRAALDAWCDDLEKLANDLPDH